MTDVVVVEAAEAFTHVAVRGPLDASGVVAVDLRLTSETVARRKPAMIDLTEVGFIASLGIGMLFVIARSMKRNGVNVVIIASTPQVLSVFETTSIAPAIPVVGTRDAALSVLGVV